MAVRTRFKFEISLSSDANEAKDLGFYKAEIFSDVAEEGGAWKTTVPISSTNLQLVLPNFTSIRFLAIITNSVDPTLTPVALDFRKNSNVGEIFTVTPLGATASTPKYGYFITTTEDITSLFVTNASTTTAMHVTVLACAEE